MAAAALAAAAVKALPALGSLAGGLIGGTKQYTQISQNQSVQLNPIIGVIAGSPEGKQLWDVQPTLDNPVSVPQTITSPESVSPIPSIPSASFTTVPSSVSALPVRSDVTTGAPGVLSGDLLGVPVYIWLIGGVGILAVVYLA